MKRQLLAVAMSGLLSLSSMAAVAQEKLKSEAEARGLSDRVMAAVTRGELDRAYGEMKRHTTLPAPEVDEGMRDSIIQRNESFNARYGKGVGYDFIGQKKLGRSMMRLSYVEQREKQPLAWVFDFYSTGSGWVLSQFAWHDNPTAFYLGQ